MSIWSSRFNEQMVAAAIVHLMFDGHKGGILNFLPELIDALIDLALATYNNVLAAMQNHNWLR